MGNSTLKTVGMELIHANPYRLLHAYPWVEPKVESLMRSIDDVGFWEGVIARPRRGGGYELAFGHHRVEAARRAGLNKLPIIVRDLDDEMMVKMMGRENGEDYKADFLSMLNSWEGAIDFSASAENPANIARLLGWTRIGGGHEKMNRVAEACANAHKLIEAGLLDRDDLADLSVSAVRDLTAPLIRELKSQDLRREHFKETQPAEKVDAAMDELKERTVRGAKSAARDVRAGRVASRDVQVATNRSINEAQADIVSPVPPDFIQFINRKCDGIDKLFEDDSYADAVASVQKVIGDLPPGEHMNKVSALMTAIRELKSRLDTALDVLQIEVEERYRKQEDQPKLEVVS